ncbi:MAG TPA: nuclear transport factor 2 family protein [Caulobacteraceae bacterium]|jgi:hypothetical protein|nr:nuclear transport factor 2 family protein [Caulobacteraceae bacterium]
MTCPTFVRSGLGVLVLALLSATPAIACPARSPAGDRHRVLALEDEWIGSHDRAALERILADDFRHPVSTGDVLTKRQHIDWMVAHPTPNRHPRFGALEVRLYGDTALAAGSVEVRNDSGKILSRNLFTDVFVYRGCRWQAVSAQETAIPAANGRPQP